MQLVQNRLTDKVCNYLRWSGDKKVTPHGFRYSIATLLDEKGISQDSIKYLLGHKDKENLQFYIRRDKRKIREIRKALIEIEEELESHLKQSKVNQPQQEDNNHTKNTLHNPILLSNHNEDKNANSMSFSNETLLKLAQTNPVLFEQLIQSMDMTTSQR